MESINFLQQPGVSANQLNQTLLAISQNEETKKESKPAEQKMIELAVTQASKKKYGGWMGYSNGYQGL